MLIKWLYNVNKVVIRLVMRWLYDWLCDGYMMVIRLVMRWLYNVNKVVIPG